jgi:uncharacterized protein (TIGR02466 family)
MNAVGIFATPIGIRQFDPQHHQQLKEKCFNIAHTETGIDNDFENEGLMHYHHPMSGLNLLDCEGFDMFHDWIKRCSLEYMNKILGHECEDVIITECWLNVCKRGSYQRMHSHGNSFVSGTYFVNFEPGKHAPLAFFNAKDLAQQFLEVKGNAAKKIAVVKHGEGTLLLWQSHVLHGYEENMKDNRMTISFNVMPATILSDGDYGFRVSRI